MKTPLAWRNLVHSKMRTLAAVAGVTFAVVLIFMQWGFLGSVEATASLIYDALRFDVLIRSREYLRLSDARTFPRTRLYQAASVEGVRAVRPFQVSGNQWHSLTLRTKRRILTMGVQPEDPPFRIEELKRKAGLLSAPEFVLVDRQSRADFGPRNKKQFGDQDLGLEAEVGGERVRVVGHFALGAGFEADGAIVLDDRGFLRVAPQRQPEDVSLGLVELAEGVDPEAAAARLRNALPKDVDVLTRRGVVAYELHLWLWEMSIGVVFLMGLGVALVVGTAIVYQVLSSDVTNHLREYATLKAIGYGDWFLAEVVLQQAVVLALLGFVPGWLLAEVLYRVTQHVARVPIEMNPWRLLGVLVLTVGMCTVSGLGALRKLARADPADLF